MGVRPVGCCGLLCGLIELFFGDAQSELLQSGAGLLLVGDTHWVSWYAANGVVATC